MSEKIPPPSYHEATGTLAYTPLVPQPLPAEPQYTGNNVYTVPIYPQQEPYANQNHCSVHIAQTELEIQEQLNNNRQCTWITIIATFIVVAIVKFALRAAFARK